MLDCLNSIAPTEEELISFALDGEALPEEANNHLQKCATCQIQTDQVEGMQQLSQDESSQEMLQHQHRGRSPSWRLSGLKASSISQPLRH